MAEEANMERLNALLSGKFLEGGWDSLNREIGADDPVKRYQARLQQYENAQIIAAPFRNPAGLQSLKALRQSTIERPTFDADAREFYSAAAYGFAREGQNSIVRYIEQCIAIVEAGPPKEPEQPKQKET